MKVLYLQNNTIICVFLGGVSTLNLKPSSQSLNLSVIGTGACLGRDRFRAWGSVFGIPGLGLNSSQKGVQGFRM